MTSSKIPWSRSKPPGKTFREIVSDAGKEPSDAYFKIAGDNYHAELYEDYNTETQITATPGTIILYDLVTYGYGEIISWDKLEAQKVALEAWAKEACEKYRCGKYRIFVTANYW